MRGGAGPTLDALALAFVAARIAYVALYVAGRSTLRSAAWSLAFAVNVAIMTMPAWR